MIPFLRLEKFTKKINPVLMPIKTVAIMIRGPSTCGFGISSGADC